MVTASAADKGGKGEETKTVTVATVEENKQMAAITKANKLPNDPCNEVSWQEKLDATLANGNLKQELEEAYKFLGGKLPKKAAGATCPVRTPRVVREAVKGGQTAPASDAKQELPCSCGLFPLLKRQGRRSMDARNRTWTGHTHAKAAFCAKPRCC